MKLVSTGLAAFLMTALLTGCLFGKKEEAAPVEAPAATEETSAPAEAPTEEMPSEDQQQVNE